MNTTKSIAADAMDTGATAELGIKKPVIILTPKQRATKAQMASRRAALVAASRQTRIGSLIEACINVLIGFGINFFANLVILPLIGFHISLGQNLFIGVLYTVISVARSYCIRRWFNGRIHSAALKLAEGAA